MWWMALTMSVLGIPDILCSSTDDVVLSTVESPYAAEYNGVMGRVDEVSIKVDEISLLLNESLKGMTERLDRMSRSMVKMATVFMQLPEIMVQLKQHSKDCCIDKMTTEMPTKIHDSKISELQILEDLNTDRLNDYTASAELTTGHNNAQVDKSQIVSETTEEPSIILQSPSKETGILNLQNPLDLIDSVYHSTRKITVDLQSTTNTSPYITSSESTTVEAPSKRPYVLTTTQPSITTSAPVTVQTSTTKTSDSTTASEITPDTIQVQVLELSNTSVFETAKGCQLGFFRIGNECFKAFKTMYTWEAAKEKCAVEGLRMAAEPRDPVAVADFLKDNIAPSYYWLGGRGDGSTFKWLTGAHIAATSLYWFSQYPVSLFSNCLIMLASHNFPTDVPFYAQPCDSTYFVLCQDENCCDGQASEKEVIEPRIITKGIITWVTADDDPVIQDTDTDPLHPLHIINQQNKTQITKNKTMNDYVIRDCDSEFYYIGSQCFIAYMDEKVNWKLAKQKCASEGLVMAQPHDPVALSFYLKQYVASSPFWLGAHGDNTDIRWLNSSVIEESSPLWYNSMSSHLNKCLMLLTNTYYQTPFYAERCFANFYTLCQGKISGSNVISKTDDGETSIGITTTAVPACKGEFFSVDSGCYKSITDVKHYTWDLAAQKCRAEGLKLAEPENPIALANYLKNNIEPSYFWMGGSADGWTFRWTNGSIIPASSRLWYRYQPSAAIGNCLLLMATTSLTNLAPLYDNPCNDLHYVVCQMVK